MARSLTSVIRDQVVSTAVEMAFLCTFRFDSAELHVWTGIGPLIFDGREYQGIGHLGTISSVKETQTMQAEGITFTLSGNIASTISTALLEEFQDRTCTLWVGFFDSDVSPGLLNDPVIIFQGRMDTMKILYSGDQSLVQIQAESAFIALENAINRRYTPADHNINKFLADDGSLINDKGFDHVAGLLDREIPWGRSDIGHGQQPIF